MRQYGNLSHLIGKILPVKQLSVTPPLHLYSYLR